MRTDYLLKPVEKITQRYKCATQAKPHSGSAAGLIKIDMMQKVLSMPSFTMTLSIAILVMYAKAIHGKPALQMDQLFCNRGQIEYCP